MRLTGMLLSQAVGESKIERGRYRWIVNSLYKPSKVQIRSRRIFCDHKKKKIISKFKKSHKKTKENFT